MKKVFTTIIALSSIWLCAHAIPARKAPTTFIQSDGTQITVTKTGDEFAHCYTTIDGIALTRAANGDFLYRTSTMIAHNASERSASETSFIAAQKEAITGTAVRNKIRALSTRRKSVMMKSQVPHSGTPKVPILLVQYSDVKFKDTDPKASFETQMNGTKSVKQYFKDQSAGKFDPEFDIYGPITLDHPQAYYGGNDSSGDDLRPGQMIKDACDKIDATLNFANYDNDHDGVVDVVYVIYAGVGEASSDNAENSVWPHQWDLTDAIGSTATYDAVTVDKYACGNELYSGRLDGIGTFCHEFSHCLGLPDFYDTTSSGSNYGMSAWSLMDYGSYNNDGLTPCGYTAYEREFMGWMTIDSPKRGETLTLATIPNGGKAYRIQSPSNANEYYLLENRQQEGWDAYIESHGMMVTHVDYDATAWAENTVNNTSTHQRMTIIPADNKLSYTNNSGDLYPNGGMNTELSDNSTPAAKLYAGGFMGQPLTEITETGGIITLKYNGQVETPVGAAATNVTTNSFTANWQAVEGALSYTLQVKKVVDNSGAELLSEDFSKFIYGTTDIGTKLDTYMNNSGWTGSSLFGENHGLRLGTSKKTGLLTSPTFDPTAAAGTVTVAFTGNSYSTDGDVTMKVSLMDGTTVLASGNVTIGKDATSQNVVLKGGTANSAITFESTVMKKRPILNAVTIYAGDVSGSLSQTARKADESTTKVFTGITGTSYDVPGLEAGESYTYQVKALFAEGIESNFSTAIKVTLGTSGIVEQDIAKAMTLEGNRLTINSEKPVAVYSIAGIALQSIAPRTYKLNRGVYIVKVGNRATKIFVK